MAAVAANRTQDVSGTVLPIETESNPVTAMDRQVMVVGDPATASKAKVSTLGELTVATLDTTASGTLTAVSQTVALVLQGDSAGAVQVTGAFVATMQVEGTLDGTNWVAINAVAAGQTFPSALITAPGLYRITPGGLAQFRVNMTAFTSGSAVVSLRASDGTGGTFVTQVLAARLTDGTTNVPVKPASTAAVAADPSLPVALHPSSPLPAGANEIGAVKELRAGTLIQTATGAAAIATATLPAAGVGLFHYITSIRLERYMTAVGTASATRNAATTTNLNGLAFTLPGDAAAQGVQSVPTDFQPITPVRSAVANTATTVATPLVAGTTYLITVVYFTAA